MIRAVVVSSPCGITRLPIGTVPLSAGLAAVGRPDRPVARQERLGTAEGWPKWMQIQFSVLSVLQYRERLTLWGSIM